MKLFNNKNTILGFCLFMSSGLFLFFGGYLPLFNRFGGIAPQLTKNLIPTESSQVDYVASIKHEEQDLWQKMTAHNITPDKVDSLIKRSGISEQSSGYESLKTTDLISSQTQDCIKAVCQDFGVDYSQLKITSIKTQTSPAAADDKGLYINDKLLRSFSDKVQKFIIGHELQHYIYKDDSHCVAVETMLTGKEHTGPNSLANQFSRFVEKRADIMASTKHADYAEGQKEFTAYLLKIFGDVMAPTHPGNKERLAIAENILSNIQYA
jgi:hypothetical protein